MPVPAAAPHPPPTPYPNPLPPADRGHADDRGRVCRVRSAAYVCAGLPAAQAGDPVQGQVRGQGQLAALNHILLSPCLRQQSPVGRASVKGVGGRGLRGRDVHGAGLRLPSQFASLGGGGHMEKAGCTFCGTGGDHNLPTAGCDPGSCGGPCTGELRRRVCLAYTLKGPKSLGLSDLCGIKSRMGIMQSFQSARKKSLGGCVNALTWAAKLCVNKLTHTLACA